MIFKRAYIFTNKKHAPQGIMSAILGIASLVTVVAVVCLTYYNHGEAPLRYAVSAFFAAVYSGIGLILGIYSRFKPDCYYTCPNIGLVTNLLAFSGTMLLLHWGGAF